MPAPEFRQLQPPCHNRCNIAICFSDTCRTVLRPKRVLLAKYSVVLAFLPPVCKPPLLHSTTTSSNVNNIINQCQPSKYQFFVKQWNERHIGLLLSAVWNSSNRSFQVAESFPLAQNFKYRFHFAGRNNAGARTCTRQQASVQDNSSLILGAIDNDLGCGESELFKGRFM